MLDKISNFIEEYNQQSGSLEYHQIDRKDTYYTISPLAALLLSENSGKVLIFKPSPKEIHRIFWTIILTYESKQIHHMTIESSEKVQFIVTYHYVEELLSKRSEG